MVDRGLQAIIPCHTAHCAMFAPPLHRTSTSGGDGGSGEPVYCLRSNETFIAPAFDAPTAVSTASSTAKPTPCTPLPAAPLDWSSPSDFRLIQPIARDNSNLSVLAGHFDFYSPFESLPRCRKVAATRSNAIDNDDDRSDSQPLWTSIVSKTDPALEDENDAASATSSTVPTAATMTGGCNLSCFTVGRHPVERAISFYYQRFYQHPDKASTATRLSDGPLPLNQHLMNELTPEQLELVALSTREGMESFFYPGTQVFIDEGMSDASCSALLGLKYTTGRAVQTTMHIPPEISPRLYPTAVANLRQCVIGLQDRWNDTLRVLDHWLPWVDFSQDPGRRKMSLFKGMETRTTLRRELYEVLVALNPCDMMLFEEMQRLFELQLAVLENEYY